MSKFLNPPLYQRLQQQFGSVKVVDAGVPMVVRRGKDYVTGKIRLDFASKGEQYRVCCPFCNDTRHRLYVHHSFGDKGVHTQTVVILLCP